MIRNILESIGGVATFPIIALVLFVLVFAGAIVWALALSRRYVEHASRLPLHNDSNDGGHVS